jgi:hypothetical protein
MRTATLVLAALLVASCGTGGLGSIGDILGSPSSTQSSDVKGTVASVDTGNQRIDLDVMYINNLRQTGGSNQRGSIYYDTNTRVVYNGRDYQVADLERGDEIEVVGVNNSGRYVAQTINVVRDVNAR